MIIGLPHSIPGPHQQTVEEPSDRAAPEDFPHWSLLPSEYVVDLVLELLALVVRVHVTLLGARNALKVLMPAHANALQRLLTVE